MMKKRERQETSTAPATRDPGPRWVVATERGIAIDVLAVPRASRTRVVGVQEGRLKIQLAAAPSDGEANEALLELIAEQLGVKRRAVSLESGGASRRKRVAVEGVGIEAAIARLATPA